MLNACKLNLIRDDPNFYHHILLQLFQYLKEVHVPHCSPEQKFPRNILFRICYFFFKLWTFDSGELKPNFSFKLKKKPKIVIFIFFIALFSRLHFEKETEIGNSEKLPKTIQSENKNKWRQELGKYLGILVVESRWGWQLSAKLLPSLTILAERQ